MWYHVVYMGMFGPQPATDTDGTRSAPCSVPSVTMGRAQELPFFLDVAGDAAAHAATAGQAAAKSSALSVSGLFGF